ncbi:sulfatase-like hydrolase/transferase [Butyrivibrio fibrisolvens]|uniref:Sulfatase N-terminal domain-containing protein n=1 Tax=Butyrivibrio fibrisolvens TaxID=831 RepID=A0A317G8Y1_BUTFI|nr:sulfatase-like hydrolase/transferase [Butyrivibrio fibrisolvens]PWT29270.1 hypothetical protein CPT75_20280 [Butyrivibrio fibrisolvens]
MLDAFTDGIYVWGAGGATELFIQFIEIIACYKNGHGLEIHGILDNNDQKWGSKYLGYTVMAPDAVWKEKRIPIVIPHIPYNAKQIAQALIAKGYEEKLHFWLGSSFLAELLNVVLMDINVASAKMLMEELCEKLKLHLDRKYLLSETVLNYLIYFMKNDCPKEFIIPFLEFYNWEHIVGIQYINIFRSYAKWFNRILAGDGDIWNSNRRMIKQDYPELYSFYNDLQIETFNFVDDEHIIVVLRDEVYIANRLISLQLILNEYDLTKKGNEKWKSYVIECMKNVELEKLMAECNNLTKDEEVLYRKVNAISEDSDVSYYFRAKHLFLNAQYQEAFNCCVFGLQRNPLSRELCELCGDVLFAEGEYSEALKYYSRVMIDKSTREQLWMITEDGDFNASIELQNKMWQCIKRYSRGNTKKANECLAEGLSDILVARARFKDNKIVVKEDKLIAKETKDNKVKISFGIEYLKSDTPDNVDVYFQGQKTTLFVFDCGEREYLLPVMRLKEGPIVFEYNGLIVSYDNKNSKIVRRFELNSWVWLRITGKIRIVSSELFAVGTPMIVKDINEKANLVINIFVDALAYSRVKHTIKELMPNAFRFFEKGCIFENCCGVGEWTQSSYPSMTTGIRSNLLPVFHPRIMIPINKQISPISLRMREQGYYCLQYAADSSDIDRFAHMGVDGGYHRYYVKDRMRIDEAIDDVLEILYKNDGKNYINIHALDVHDVHFNMKENASKQIASNKVPFKTLALNDLYGGENDKDNRERYDAREKVYLTQITAVDNALGKLFDFLQKEYTSDEYTVVLHSDHGAFGGEFQLSKEHVNIPLMIRGKNIPALGSIKDEVLSGLDLYAIYEYLFGISRNEEETSRLPRALGGEGREYAITQWKYPNQRYFMAINLLDLAIQIETEKPVSSDLKIDISRCSYNALETITSKETGDVKSRMDELISIFTTEYK